MKIELRKYLLSVFFIAIGLVIGSPTAMAQKAKSENVTLNVTSATISQVFTQMKKQTGYNFVIKSECQRKQQADARGAQRSARAIQMHV